MRKADWRRVMRPVAESSPDISIRASDNLVYRVPWQYVVQGVLAENTSFSTSVHLWRVTLPLYVPSDVLILNYSHRLGNDHLYEPDSDELVTTVQETLATIPDESAAAAFIERSASLERSRYDAAVLAGLQVLDGYLADALATVDRWRERPVRNEWDGTVREFLTTLGQAAATGHAAARQVLRAECQRGATVLGLTPPAYP